MCVCVWRRKGKGGAAFDHQIGFAELDLEGLWEEKAWHTAKGRGEEIMNMPVNISPTFQWIIRTQNAENVQENNPNMISFTNSSDAFVWRKRALLAAWQQFEMEMHLPLQRG